MSPTEPGEQDGPSGRPEPNLTRSTITGLRWTYAETAISAVLKIVMAGIMARLLSPAAFGLLAIGDLSLRFVNYFSRSGITQALIQRPALTAQHIRAGWTLSVGLGVVFYAVAFAAAPFAAGIFNAPDATPVIRWLALDLVIHGLGAPAHAMLRRELRFDAIAARNIASYLVGYPVVGVALAMNDAGVYALVGAVLSQSALRSLLAYLAVRHDVRPTFEREPLVDVLSFGGRVSFISFLEFLGHELDTFAVGRYAGTSDLGLYNRGYLLARLPVSSLTTALSNVLFPAFSAVQNDMKRFRAAYLTSVRVASAIILPVAAGMAVAAPEIVAVVLGDEFLGATEVLRPIAGVAGLSTITHFAAIAAEARGFLNQKIAIALMKVAVLAGLLVLAAEGPLWGYGAALLGAATVTHVAYFLLARRVVEASGREILARYLPSVAASAVVAGAIALVRGALLASDMALVVVLVAEVATGAVTTIALLRSPFLRPATAEVVGRLTNAGMVGKGGRADRLVHLATGVQPRRR